MTFMAIIELVVALALIGGGIYLLRRPWGESGKRDTQGAVLLFAIGTIVAIHGLGLMDYRMSAAEEGLFNR